MSSNTRDASPDTPGGSTSGADAPEDSQLTIRIPNPKMYMARQSQWKGRRGKPRCDHCRLNNLKCDRVLPTCNHCSFGPGRECKYTPLPTPAHRGIPRCDRCRLKNLKCNRDLPICNHCAEDKEGDCIYTPKKRHKVPAGTAVSTRERPVMPYTAKTASFLVSDTPSFNIAFPIKLDKDVPSSYPEGYGPMDTDGSDADEPERETTPYAPRGPRTEYQAHHWPPKTTPFPSLPVGETSTSNLPVAGRAHSAFDPSIVLTPPHVEPWIHTAYAPLPGAITDYLVQTANAIEMPARHAFDDALGRFLADLSAELKTTAVLPPDQYAEVAQAVARGDTTRLPPRLGMWTALHHVHSGSAKMYLLVLLRDNKYGAIDTTEEERRRAEFAMRVDHKWYGKTGEKYAETVPEISDTFERYPVQQQIFDVLVYAHRNHGTAAQILDEVRAVGMASITWPMAEMFVRLCPLCNLRAKSAAAAASASPTSASGSTRSRALSTASASAPPQAASRYQPQASSSKMPDLPSLSHALPPPPPTTTRYSLSQHDPPHKPLSSSRREPPAVSSSANYPGPSSPSYTKYGTSTSPRTEALPTMPKFGPPHMNSHTEKYGPLPPVRVDLMSSPPRHAAGSSHHDAAKYGETSYGRARANSTAARYADGPSGYADRERYADAGAKYVDASPKYADASSSSKYADLPPASRWDGRPQVLSPKYAHSPGPPPPPLQTLPPLASVTAKHSPRPTLPGPSSFGIPPSGPQRYPATF